MRLHRHWILPLAVLVVSIGGCSELLGIDEFQPPAGAGGRPVDGDFGGGDAGGGGGESQRGVLSWWRAFGGAGEDRASSVARLAEGVAIAGLIDGTVDLGTGSLGTAGSESMYVATLGADGETLAAIASAGAGQVEQAHVVVAPDGTLVVVGSYRDAAIEVGSASLPAPPAGMARVFVLRLDSALTPSSLTDVADADDVHIAALASGSGGQVALGGWVSGQLVPKGKTPLVGGSDRDAFVMELTASGAVAWALAPRAAGDSDEQHVSALAYAADDTLRVGGSFAGALAFASTPSDSRGPSDGFAVTLDAQGQYLSSTELGGGTAQVDVTSIVLRENGSLLAGTFTSELTLDRTMRSAGDRDIFIAAYDTSGEGVWSERYGSTGTDDLHAMVALSDGSLIAVGSFSATWQLQDDLTPVTSAGEQDVMVMRVSPDGAPIWMEGFGRQQSDTAMAVTLTGAEQLVLAGYFVDGLKLADDVLMTHGGMDGVVASFTP